MGHEKFKKKFQFFADDMLISPVQKQETITSVLLVVLKCMLALSQFRLKACYVDIFGRLIRSLSVSLHKRKTCTYLKKINK